MSDVLIQEPGLQSPDLPNTRAFRVQLIIIVSLSHSQMALCSLLLTRADIFQLVRDRSITHLPLPSYKIYTAQLKATASPRQKRHRARAPLKVLKKSLPKFRFRTTNYRHLKPIPRFTRPREEKNYSRAPLGARESNSSKTTVTHHMSPHLKNPRFGTGAKNARKHHKSTTFGKEKGTSFGSPHTVKVPNTPPQNDLSSENI